MKGIWTYSDLLPPVEESFRLSLGEGNTPLIRSGRLGAMLGLENLYFKLEAVNPSGSYKDRFAAAAVSRLIQKKNRFCLATSSGNTGSALAAYCAAAGIKCYLAIVDGAPAGKMQQMRAYGAETLMIRDFGKDARVTEEVFSGLKSVADHYGTLVQISAYRYSPLAMAGVQTIAYELADALPGSNTHVFSPAGGGGLTLALAKGFSVWKEHHPGYAMPRVHCVQPAGNDTIAGPLCKGLQQAQAVAQSTTAISGLQVPNVIDGDEVIGACRALDGTGYGVTDELVYACQADLAAKEGIFCEPAGAVALAGVVTALKKKQIDKRDHVVCLVTGHGFKDPRSAESMAGKSAGHYFDSAGETFRYIESQVSKKSKID